MNTLFTSQYWINHFKANALEQRVNWQLPPSLTEAERQTIKAHYKPGS